MNVLEIDSVQKRYHNVVILSSVYLKCATGDIVGLLGRNGSGKSTLLKIISGYEKADNIFISLNGNKLTTNRRWIETISYLPQEHFLPPNISVQEVIKLSILKHEIPFFCEDEMLQKVLHNNVSDLSGGELRYLEIKLILENPSKFVLLDEPYLGLAPIMIEKVNEMIQSKAKTKGIIITDHNFRTLTALSNKIVLLKEGVLQPIQNNSELITNGYIREGML